jgi:predicted ABC-type ATPase
LPRPRTIVVAGPPGSGKSSRFPLSLYQVEWFNADDRAAELNRGSFHKIPAEIRAKVNGEFERWISDRIRARKSFAIETTLRSPITFEQARVAREGGFWTVMEYVMAGTVEESVQRIMERSYRGGHSASERLVREIYEKSTRNLLTALDFVESGIEILRIYDNSELHGHVRRVLAFRRGRPRSIATEVPTWLESLFRGTKFEIAALRETLKVQGLRKDRSLER